MVLSLIVARPYQEKMACKLDHAIWNEEGAALAVAPVAGGKTVVLNLTAAMAVDRGHSAIICSRSPVIADQSLKTLQRMRPDISAGLYTGRRKAANADILFATAKTLANHLDVADGVDLILIDECDQAFVRDTTKEYSAIIKVARRYAGVTGTPFVLSKGLTVPIFGRGKARFNKPCFLVTKAELRDGGFFHFIEPAPVAPSRVLKIDHSTKIDLGCDFDCRIQAVSQPMLTAIATDTKTTMALLPANAQALFFGSIIAQCDAQRDAFNAIGLNFQCYHNGMSISEQREIEARFRAGEIQGLCTVSKINRGFDCPTVSLVVIGFGSASRSRYEQMCGRSQRVDDAKNGAWVLDYGGHGQRFGSANWDYPEALEFDRREKLRGPAVQAIRVPHRDPKCEATPDRFMDFVEGAVDLFEIACKIHHAATGNVGVRITYGHSMGLTFQTLYPNGYAAWVLRCLGAGETAYDSYGRDHGNANDLLEVLNSAQLPTHLLLRRVFNTFHHKIMIAPVGFRRSGQDIVFNDKDPPLTDQWLRRRAHDRMVSPDE